MKHDKHTDLALVIVAAAILAAVNIGVWLAAQQGAIAPMGNLILWTAFAVLNVVSFVWAISVLGLQPLVVALSYLAGGFLAFKGVQGVSGVRVAEITTAGATYSAFGALAVCNCTVKIRHAFFSKRQVPFIFIIAALLVFDAVMNSEISGAEGNVILNAVVFPFVLGGVIIGLVWSVLARYGIGKRSIKEPKALTAEHSVAVAEKVKETAESNTLRIQMPVHAEMDEEIDAVAAMAEAVELSEEVELPVAEAVETVMEQAEKIIEQEEEFFPLEIDKDNDFIAPEEESCESVETAVLLDALDGDLYSSMDFDIGLYDSDANEEDYGAVMVEEPIVSLSLDSDEETDAASAAAFDEEVQLEPIEESIAQAEEEPVSQVDAELGEEAVMDAAAELDEPSKLEPIEEPIAQAEEEPVSQVDEELGEEAVTDAAAEPDEPSKPEPVEEPIAQAEEEPVSQVDAELVEEAVTDAAAEADEPSKPEPVEEPIARVVEKPVSQMDAEIVDETVTDSAAEPVAPVKPEPIAEPLVQAEPTKKAKSEDWLSGHLDLLNKLK